MNNERLSALIEKWEPELSEVVRTIGNTEGEVERIIKYRVGENMKMVYALHRYFETGCTIKGPTATSRTEVSIDLQDVDADTIIQHLAERL